MTRDGCLTPSRPLSRRPCAHVVKVLVPNDGLDGVEVGVRRRLRRREDEARVEDVQRLILWMVTGTGTGTGSQTQGSTAAGSTHTHPWRPC